MRTPSVSSKAVSRKWYLFDATDATVGRVASQIASILRGKNKANFCRHMDLGDYVVVINAEKVRLSGKKETDKLYWHYTGFPGGERSISPAKQRERFPERILFAAIKGMLPKGPLGRQMVKKLKVYNGEAHPHLAQQPEKLEL